MAKAADRVAISTSSAFALSLDESQPNSYNPTIVAITSVSRYGKVDQKPLGASHHPHRRSLPDRQRHRGLHLAQGLLGLHVPEPQRCRPTRPRPPDPQPPYGFARPRLGVAVEVLRWEPGASQHRDPSHPIPSERTSGCAAVSRDRPRHLLLGGDYGVLLGV